MTGGLKSGLHSEVDVNRTSTKLALFTMLFGGAGMLNLKPVIVGGLIESFGFSARQAGLVAGTEMAGVGIGVLVAVLIGTARNGRKLALAGAFIAMLASLGPDLWRDFPLVLSFRLVAGIGCGMLVSSLIAALAITSNPERTFGINYVFGYFANAALYPVAMALMAAHGVRAVYFLVALLILPVFVLIRSVPVSADGNRAAVARAPLPIARTAMCLAGTAIYFAGIGGVWAFIERIGMARSIEPAQIGRILSISQIAFVAGAGGAALLGQRWGRAIPIALSLPISLLALFTIQSSQDATAFAVGMFLFALAWMFFFPFLSGLASVQDLEGRVAVLNVPAQTFGLAVGPAVAGFLVVEEDYSRVLMLGAACLTVACLVLMPVLVLSDRRRDGGPAEQAGVERAGSGDILAT